MNNYCKPFVNRELTPRSFMQRLFGQHPTENALIEVNNLLATRPVGQISSNDIITIERRYRLSLKSEFGLNLEEFYAVYFNAQLRHHILDDAAEKDLAHLEQILQLSMSTTVTLRQMVGEDIFRTAYKEAVGNGQLSEQALSRLSQLASYSKLPDEVVEQISEDTRSNFFDCYTHSLASDLRLSIVAVSRLQQVKNDLGISLAPDSNIQQRLERMHWYWQLEHEALKVMETQPALQKSEQCYLKVSVCWFEPMTGRHYGVNYSSFQKAGEAVRYDLQQKAEPGNAYSLQLIDKGIVYLTNKRIYFEGNDKNKIITYDKILKILPFNNGIQVNKPTGKDPFLYCNEKVDVLFIILRRLLNEMNG